MKPYSDTLFFFDPNAFVHEARAVLRPDLLLLHPLFALAHFRRPIGWHHLFHRSCLHPIRRLR